MKMELNKVYQGNSIDVLRTFPDNFIDCCVTSPPYWGLRDYGTGNWQGGCMDCDHKGKPMRTKENVNKNTGTGIDVKNAVALQPFKETCGKCGAIRIDEQLGLEKTPEEFIGKMVLLFREVKRVLKPTGTIWVNMGDSYFGGGGSSGHTEETKNLGRKTNKYGSVKTANRKSDSLKPKDLVGIPWMLAFALRADGWWLRSDIIWSKPNPMPESVTDRPTKAHEYIFLLTKSQSYFYDAEAIKEDAVTNENRPDGIVRDREYGYDSKQAILRGYKTKDDGIINKGTSHHGDSILSRSKRNKRSVWHIPSYPFTEAHFATFPEDLIVDCIRAGSSEYGCCAECGKPYERIVNKQQQFISGSGKSGKLPKGKNGVNMQGGASTGDVRKGPVNVTQTKGWQSTCSCNAAVIRSVVLDPFSGAGTTAIVAEKLNRNHVGCELNPKYIEIYERRRLKTFGLFA